MIKAVNAKINSDLLAHGNVEQSAAVDAFYGRRTSAHFH
jgi:hypothetical protein